MIKYPVIKGFGKMKIEKQLNYLIIARIAEIIFVLAFLVLSYPLFENMRLTSSLLKESAGLELTFTSLKIENQMNYPLYPISEKEALNKLEPTKIVVENNSLTEENFWIVLKISKNTTLDYHYLNMAIEDKIYSLNNLTMEEDSENYKFFILKDVLKGNKKEYNLKIWLDETAGNDMQNKVLISSFELKKAL